MLDTVAALRIQGFASAYTVDFYQNSSQTQTNSKQKRYNYCILEIIPKKIQRRERQYIWKIRQYMFAILKDPFWLISLMGIVRLGVCRRH